MTEKSKTAHFEREKGTKNTVKFTEIQTPGQAPIIGALYIQRNPDKLQGVLAALGRSGDVTRREAGSS